MLKMYTAVKWQRSILPKARNVIQLWFTFHVDNSFLLYRMPKKNARYPTIYASWVTPKLRLCRYRELCKVWKGFLLDLWHLILRGTVAIEKKSVLVLSNQTLKIWEQMQHLRIQVGFVLMFAQNFCLTCWITNLFHILILFILVTKMMEIDSMHSSIFLGSWNHNIYLKLRIVFKYKIKHINSKLEYILEKWQTQRGHIWICSSLFSIICIIEM